MKTMKVSGSAWSISTPTPLSNLQIAYPLEHNRHKVAQHVLRNLLLGFNDYGMLTAVFRLLRGQVNRRTLRQSPL